MKFTGCASKAMYYIHTIASGGMRPCGPGERSLFDSGHYELLAARLPRRCAVERELLRHLEAMDFEHAAFRKQETQAKRGKTASK